MHSVRKINYIDGYKISLTFDDKTTKVVNLESYLKRGVFLPLRDPEYFKLVKVKYDTLAWPNEADFCPDVLYEMGVDEPVKLQRKNTAQIKRQPAYALSKRPSKKK